MELSSHSIASLTLFPSGDDKLIIRRHLSGLYFFGITLNGLMCSVGGARSHAQGMPTPLPGARTPISGSA